MAPSSRGRAPGPCLLAAVLSFGLTWLSDRAHAVEHAASGPAGAEGRDVYVQHCARCHQADGSGVDGLYPSLRGLPGDSAGRDGAIRALLSGRVGSRETDGMTVDRVMPTHGYLANETIAATLSYVLREWADTDQPVTTESVAGVRLELLSAHPAGTDPATGVSPLAELDTTQYVTSSGPPLEVDEFERARRLYYGRCTGCHGVLREGVAGSPLTPEIMRQHGTEYLRASSATARPRACRTGAPATS